MRRYLFEFYKNFTDNNPQFKKVIEARNIDEAKNKAWQTANQASVYYYFVKEISVGGKAR